MSRNRQSARLKGGGSGRGRGAPVSGAVDSVWGLSQPTEEELAAKKAAITKRNEEHVNKFIIALQGKHPTIFEDVDASDTEHLDASKHPPRTRPKRKVASKKISNPYVSKKKTAAATKVVPTKQPAKKRGRLPKKQTSAASTTTTKPTSKRRKIAEQVDDDDANNNNNKKNDDDNEGKKLQLALQISKNRNAFNDFTMIELQGVL